MRPDADGPYILASALPKIRADAVREAAKEGAGTVFAMAAHHWLNEYADQLEKEGTE